MESEDEWGSWSEIDENTKDIQEQNFQYDTCASMQKQINKTKSDTNNCVEEQHQTANDLQEHSVPNIAIETHSGTTDNISEQQGTNIAVQEQKIDGKEQTDTAVDNRKINSANNTNNEDSDISDNEPLINIKRRIEGVVSDYDNTDDDEDFVLKKSNINSSDSESVPSPLQKMSDLDESDDDLVLAEFLKAKRKTQNIRDTAWKKKGKAIKRKKPFQQKKVKNKHNHTDTSMIKKAKLISLKEARQSQLRRKIHLAKLNALLASNGLRRRNIPADGNCFFNSVLQQLDINVTTQDFRQTICDHIEENKQHYAVHFPTMDIDSEIAALRQNGAWSSEIADAMPLAVANVTKYKVAIYSSRITHPYVDIVPDLTSSQDNKVIKLAYVAITGCEHYDGCIAYSDKTDHYRPAVIPEMHKTPTKSKRTENAVMTPRKQAIYISPVKKQLTRKRKAQPNKWKKNVRKNLRNSGQEYVNVHGKTVSKRKIKPANCEKCRYKCSQKINDEQRNEIFNRFWGLASYNRQKDFVCSRVHQKPSKSSLCECSAASDKTPQRTRKYARQYTFENGGEIVRVCKSFFQNTLDIGEKYINHALVNSDKGIFTSTEKRGKSTSKNKTPQTKIEEIRKHIESFPTVESHYTRRSTQRKFLAHDLNIKKMYKLYQEQSSENGTEPVSIRIYQSIFNNEYNFSFHKPKKDQCHHCEKYKNTVLKTDDLQKQYDDHQNRKIKAREEKQKDKLNAEQHADIYAATFDMQAVLTCPCSLVSQLYYKRKLACYNLSIYSLGDKSASCFVWNETEGKRGSCQIGTCLHLHLKSLPQVTKHAILWSDTCGGQNRNQFIAGALLKSVNDHPTLQILDQKFLESGHTQMECDSMHSAIEHAKKLTSIYEPCQYDTVIRLARKTKPYTVIPIKYTDILDFKDFTTNVCKNVKIDASGERINWMKIRWIRVKKSHPDEMFIKYSFDNEAEFIRMKVLSTGRRGRQPGISDYQLKYKYDEKIAISEQKKRDLLSLCKSGVIPKNHEEFYKRLPSSRSTRDNLPEPDVLESEVDTDQE